MIIFWIKNCLTIVFGNLIFLTIIFWPYDFSTIIFWYTMFQLFIFRLVDKYLLLVRDLTIFRLYNFFDAFISCPIFLTKYWRSFFYYATFVDHLLLHNFPYNIYYHFWLLFYHWRFWRSFFATWYFDVVTNIIMLFAGEFPQRMGGSIRTVQLPGEMRQQWCRSQADLSQVRPTNDISTSTPCLTIVYSHHKMAAVFHKKRAFFPEALDFSEGSFRGFGEVSLPPGAECDVVAS